MDRTERFYRIERLIRARGSVSFETLRTELEVSPATLKRDLQYLRDRLDAPIVYDRLDNGYRFAGDARGTAHELPGLWFSDQEIHALLTMHQLIQGLDADSMLGRHLQPLRDKLQGLLGSRGDATAAELLRRVHVVAAARRPVDARIFETIGSALLERRRLELRYFTRGRGAESRREVSPQRLTHYRSTWYLDAWCHRSEGLRRFALDAVREATVQPARAKEVALASVRAELDGGYGVFAGRRLQWATLEFGAEAAQWVATEQWHPQQQTQRLADGRLQLRLPYADPTELAMDILRHGDQVRVLAPQALADEVAGRLRRAARWYDTAPDAA
ncbi:MAG: WYL domain-containing protein [Burkholderiales bacterium]|nr:WYL domain-containing protein [Burkholderiales bacterium]